MISDATTLSIRDLSQDVELLHLYVIALHVKIFLLTVLCLQIGVKVFWILQRPSIESLSPY